jgi:hypothetical protein
MDDIVYTVQEYSEEERVGLEVREVHSIVIPGQSVEDSCGNNHAN